MGVWSCVDVSQRIWLCTVPTTICRVPEEHTIGGGTMGIRGTSEGVQWVYVVHTECKWIQASVKGERKVI
jgi:hypothetical protein